MSIRPLILDRYILGQTLGTMCGVLAVVMSLMVLEHFPRLLEITHLSGHRGYIVVSIVGGLLPEYGGIGLLVGLFLGIALTVRRLALRRELDVIEACGIAPSRWMRFPLTLAGIVSILTIVNQGWLMPAGETRLAEIGTRMADGEFGHRLEAGQFIDLGSGSVLRFEKVDAVNGELFDLFLRSGGTIFTARRGSLWQLPSGSIAIELRDGQLIQEKAGKVLEFSRLQHRVAGVEGAPAREPPNSILKRVNMGSLWAKGTTPSRSAVYGRCLWAALVLFLPPVALVLGKPSIRQSGAVGILLGMIALVLGLKMISPLIDGNAAEPELLAAGILVIWGSFVYGLIRGEKVFGYGFIDIWARRTFQNVRRSRA